MMASSQNLRATGDRIEQLLDELRASAEPRSYTLTQELLRSVTDLYGGALARVVEIAEESAPEVTRRLAEDELVASLLLVHGLHPESARARVEAALAGARPFLAQHGGDVELLDMDLDAGAILLGLLGSCDGCPSSSVTLRQAVEKAVLEAAPEIVRIDVRPGTEAGLVTPVALGRQGQFQTCPTEVPA
jgi:Fe-S cluster biogenesis protein NfuA